MSSIWSSSRRSPHEPGEKSSIARCARSAAAEEHEFSWAVMKSSVPRWVMVSRLRERWWSSRTLPTTSGTGTSQHGCAPRRRGLRERRLRAADRRPGISHGSSPRSGRARQAGQRRQQGGGFEISCQICDFGSDVAWPVGRGFGGHQAIPSLSRSNKRS